MNTQIPRTNEKLAHARLHLQLLAESEAAEPRNTLRAAGFQESVLFHLAGAYVGFLREIAETYKIKDQQISLFEDLQQALMELERESSEAKELETLLQPGQWLYQLTHAYERCWSSDRKNTGPRDKTAETAGAIQLLDVAGSGTNHRQLSSWQHSLLELIQRHREHMLEW